MIHLYDQITSAVLRLLLNALWLGDTKSSITSCSLYRTTFENILRIMFSRVIGLLFVTSGGSPFILFSAIRTPSPISGTDS